MVRENWAAATAGRHPGRPPKAAGHSLDAGVAELPLGGGAGLTSSLDPSVSPATAESLLRRDAIDPLARRVDIDG